jgi:hypothetical protein
MVLGMLIVAFMVAMALPAVAQDSYYYEDEVTDLMLGPFTWSDGATIDGPS